MDGAGADNDDQSVAVLTMKDSADGLSCLQNQCGGLFCDGEFGLDRARRRQRLDFNDMLVVDWSNHSPPLPMMKFDSISEVL